MANKSNDECKAETIEQVSTTTSSLHNTNGTAADTQEVGWKSRLDKSMIYLEQTCEFDQKVQPQLSNVNKLISAELEDIQTKKSQLGEQFKNKLDEYKKAKEQLEQLEEEHNELTENTKLLTDDLECISDELDQMKKKMESKSSSVTDATTLVDIRAAIQRLKKENKEMDIRIGVLDYQLIQARMTEAKGSQELSTSHGVSDDNDEESEEDDDDASL